MLILYGISLPALFLLLPHPINVEIPSQFLARIVPPFRMINARFLPHENSEDPREPKGWVWVSFREGRYRSK